MKTYTEQLQSIGEGGMVGRLYQAKGMTRNEDGEKSEQKWGVSNWGAT
jgi:hypothetical protein